MTTHRLTRGYPLGGVHPPNKTTTKKNLQKNQVEAEKKSRKKPPYKKGSFIFAAK